jgi:FixJ family two-component response regulator
MGKNRGSIVGRRHTNNRAYNISHIWDTHHEIMRLLVMGLSRQEIARTMGVSPVTVTNVQNSPICRDRLNALREKRDANAMDMTNAIRELAPLAVRKLEDTMSCG